MEFLPASYAAAAPPRDLGERAESRGGALFAVLFASLEPWRDPAGAGGADAAIVAPSEPEAILAADTGSTGAEIIDPSDSARPIEHDGPCAPPVSGAQPTRTTSSIADVPVDARHGASPHRDRSDSISFQEEQTTAAPTAGTRRADAERDPMPKRESRARSPSGPSGPPDPRPATTAAESAAGGVAEGAAPASAPPTPSAQGPTGAPDVAEAGFAHVRAPSMSRKDPAEHAPRGIPMQADPALTLQPAPGLARPDTSANPAAAMSAEPETAGEADPARLSAPSSSEGAVASRAESAAAPTPPWIGGARPSLVAPGTLVLTTPIETARPFRAPGSPCEERAAPPTRGDAGATPMSLANLSRPPAEAGVSMGPMPWAQMPAAIEPSRKAPEVATSPPKRPTVAIAALTRDADAAAARNMPSPSVAVLMPPAEADLRPVVPPPEDTLPTPLVPWGPTIQTLGPTQSAPDPARDPAAKAQAVPEEAATAILRDAAERTVVSVDDAQLGMLRIVLSGSADHLHVILHADRTETADLIRRGLGILVAELRDEGFASASFAFDDRGGRHGPPDAARPPARAPSRDPECLTTGTRSGVGTLPGRLDLRV